MPPPSHLLLTVAALGHTAARPGFTTHPATAASRQPLAGPLRRSATPLPGLRYPVTTGFSRISEKVGSKRKAGTCHVDAAISRFGFCAHQSRRSRFSWALNGSAFEPFPNLPLDLKSLGICSDFSSTRSCDVRHVLGDGFLSQGLRMRRIERRPKDPFPVPSEAWLERDFARSIGHGLVMIEVMRSSASAPVELSLDAQNPCSQRRTHPPRTLTIKFFRGTLLYLLTHGGGVLITSVWDASLPWAPGRGEVGEGREDRDTNDRRSGGGAEAEAEGNNDGTRRDVRCIRYDPQRRLYTALRVTFAAFNAAFALSGCSPMLTRVRVVLASDCKSEAWRMGVLDLYGLDHAYNALKSRDLPWTRTKPFRVAPSTLARLCSLLRAQSRWIVVHREPVLITIDTVSAVRASRLCSHTLAPRHAPPHRKTSSMRLASEIHPRQLLHAAHVRDHFHLSINELWELGAFLAPPSPDCDAGAPSRTRWPTNVWCSFVRVRFSGASGKRRRMGYFLSLEPRGANATAQPSVLPSPHHRPWRVAPSSYRPHRSLEPSTFLNRGAWESDFLAIDVAAYTPLLDAAHLFLTYLDSLLSASRRFHSMALGARSARRKHCDDGRCGDPSSRRPATCARMLADGRTVLVPEGAAVGKAEVVRRAARLSRRGWAQRVGVLDPSPLSRRTERTGAGAGVNGAMTGARDRAQ
ncbi:hypothetical protein C8R45DRAFT_945962 [Mycena sanguinolenta]|nr:hypothetical protein C8R45DRAFT_945962 [Mycena sanguinolenta]